MVIVLSIALCLALLGFGFYFYKFKEKKQFVRTYKDLIKDVKDLTTERNGIQKKINENKIEIEKVEQHLEFLKKQQEAAEELAGKELELEREKRIAEFTEELNKEYEDLRSKSNVEQLQHELQILNSSIENAKKTMKIWGEETRKFLEESDFQKFHSIILDPTELKDVEIIKKFAPTLNRPDAFFKLIWAEYYQKKLQKLCKDLQVEKVCGIYAITNVKTKAKYVGQSVNIADRFKTHVKTGLGVGSTAYKTNKFYHAMFTEGPENFTFELIEACPQEKLNERDKYWIDFFDTVNNGYNSKAGG